MPPLTNKPSWFQVARSHPSPVTDRGGIAVSSLAALVFVLAQLGVISESAANDIAGWVAVGGLVFIAVARLIRAPFWMIESRDREIARYERLVGALALLHAPGIEDIQPISKEGKALTFEEVKTDEDLIAWNQKVDAWWKRFQGIKPTFTLLEQNQIAYMDSADYDSSMPRVNFNPQYLERWRNVKSTWQTLDNIMKEREAQRQAVRSEMIREGFDPKLLPPHFAGSEVKG